MLRPILILGAVLLSAACAASPAAQAGVPADFQLRLHYAEGSLPPPDHYSYRIEFAADGSATFTLTPDYPGPDVPVWSREFRYDTAALVTALNDGGLFSTRWQQPAAPPIGGEQHWLTVIADGVVHELPPFVSDDQQPAARALLAAVEAQVPAELRNELMRLRDQYVDAQP